MSRDRIALVDADSLIYISCYCKENENKTLQDCCDVADNFIKNILDATKANRYLLFLTIGKGFRYKVYEEYKANRKTLKPLEYYVEVRQYLIDKYQAISHNELEADDLCLIYNKRVENSFISSPDKDMLKLEGRHYNYKQHKWVTVSKEEADLHFWTSMITGDTIDNVKGIPGKGIKYAEQMLPDSEQTHAAVVLDCYIYELGEYRGIEEFHKNYKALKILDDWPNIEMVSPIEYNKLNEYKEENN